MNNCRDCRFLHREQESWEMPECYWYECSAIPAMSNLSSFPFKNTRCIKFEKREKPLKPTLAEIFLEDE